MAERDKKALKILGVALALFLLLQFGLPAPSTGGGGASVSSVSDDSLAALEQNLAEMQARVRQRPVGQAELQWAEQSLASRESGLLDAANPALAQAEMRSLVGDLLNKEGIPLGNSRFGTPELEGLDYVQTPIDITFTCAIEQLVNLVAEVGNADKLLTTRRIRVRPENKDTKSIQVDMRISGYMPVQRAPELAERARQTIERARGGGI